MALHMTAGTIPESLRIEGETAAASKSIRENSSDSMVKAVMRDRDQKLFSGTGSNKAYLFDEYAENLAITLSDFNPVYAPFFDVTPHPDVQYSPTANAKVYIVMFKTTEGVAKDWVKDSGAAGQDGRRSFISSAHVSVQAGDHPKPCSHEVKHSWDLHQRQEEP